MRYALDINKSKKSYTNAVVRDLLSTTGTKINKDSIRIQKGQWVINDSKTQWYLLNEIDVTNQYTIKSNSDQSGFEIDLGDIGVNGGFTITYQAHLDYTPVEGEKINNKDTFTTDQIQTIEKLREVIYLTGGGSGNGYQYGIKLLKVDEDHKLWKMLNLKLHEKEITPSSEHLQVIF